MPESSLDGPLTSKEHDPRYQQISLRHHFLFQQVKDKPHPALALSSRACARRESVSMFMTSRLKCRRIKQDRYHEFLLPFILHVVFY